MAVVGQGPGEYELEELEAEYKASQQRLASKDQALKIFQEQLRNSEYNSQRLQQEINQLRSQLTRVQLLNSPRRQNSGVADDETQPISVEEKQRYIQELEAAQIRISELERQIQVIEDEKAELASERDYFSGKCDSLTKCLEEERNTPQLSQSTLQSAIEENKLLKLELVDVKAERDHARSRIERYKKAVERQKAIEASTKQALHQSPSTDKKQLLLDSVRRVRELEALANNLSEVVKEKSIALLHQKKANKMLATRIAELEHKLKVVEVSGLWTNCGGIPELSQAPLIPEITGNHIPVSTQCYREQDSSSEQQKVEGDGVRERREEESEAFGCSGENSGSKLSMLVAEH